MSRNGILVLAANLIDGATVIEWDGRKVINVEESNFDAIEAAPIMNEYLEVAGLFAEPINLALVGVYEI